MGAGSDTEAAALAGPSGFFSEFVGGVLSYAPDLYFDDGWHVYSARDLINAPKLTRSCAWWSQARVEGSWDIPVAERRSAPPGRPLGHCRLSGYRFSYEKPQSVEMTIMRHPVVGDHVEVCDPHGLLGEETTDQLAGVWRPALVRRTRDRVLDLAGYAFLVHAILMVAMTCPGAGSVEGREHYIHDCIRSGRTLWRPLLP